MLMITWVKRPPQDLVREREKQRNKQKDGRKEETRKKNKYEQP